jgi:hypothetical protein
MNDLPDDDLLEIFDFYVYKYQDLDLHQVNRFGMEVRIEWWQPLVHVCRRWRCLVFGSPRRPNLQICYTPGTSARKTLDVWPALHLLILGELYEIPVDDVIAVLLEHRDRVR